MKIAIYIPKLNMGGAENVVINLFNNFNNSNYYLITDKKSSNQLNRILNKKNLIHLDSKKNYFLKILSLIWIFKKYKFNLICSNLTHANIECLIVNYFINKKLYIVEHNIPSTYLKIYKIKGVLLKFLVKNLYNRTEGIITVSEEIKKDLIKTFQITPSIIHVIYNPIDYKELIKQSNQTIDKIILEKINGREYIINIGRLSKEKNQIFLIEYLKDYLTKNNICLIIVGAGELFNDLNIKIKSENLEKFIFLTGNLDNPYSLLQKSKYYIHSSLVEGFGLVLFEALFFNKKIFVLESNYVYEIIQKKNLGIIFSKNDKFETIEKQNKDFKPNIKFINNFKVEVITKKYKQILNSNL